MFELDPTGHETVLYSFSNVGTAQLPSFSTSRRTAGRTPIRHKFRPHPRRGWEPSLPAWALAGAKTFSIKSIAASNACCDEDEDVILTEAL